MTRAIKLLVAGDARASFAMHPLAVPTLGAGALLIASTVWATWALGSPVRVHKTSVGRAAMASGLVVYGATFVLWVLRWFGLFGGPVAVW